MASGTGLRERKRALTRRALNQEAVRLFLERGFDNVTVAEIADGANVALTTL
ncbi:MAG: TetR family transcriptional regulator, partial [Microbacterium sp. 14-71-5]